MLDDSIKEEIVDLSLSESHVASIGHVDFVSFLVVDEGLDNTSEMLHLVHAFFVEFGIFLIKSDMVVIVLIEGETLWPAVLSLLLGHEETQDVLLGTEVFFGWSPDLHLLVLLNKLHLLVIVDS